MDESLKEFVDETRWIGLNSAEAKVLIGQEIEKLTGKPVPPEVLDGALKRITFTVDPLVSTILQQAEYAHTAGFLKEKPDLADLLDLTLLEEVLRSRQIEPEWTKEVPKTVPGQELEAEAKK